MIIIALNQFLHCSKPQQLVTIMRNISIILTIGFFVLLVSCDSKNVKEQTTEQSVFTSKSDTSDKSQNDTLKNVDNIKPEIFLFKYSECKENCNDYERILSKKYKGDSLFLKIGSIQNCIGKFRLDIEKSDTKLNLGICVKEEIVKRKSGKVDTILTTDDCECYYYFDIGIKHIAKEFKSILINGNKLGGKQKGIVKND